MDFTKLFIFHKRCSFQCSYNTYKMFHGRFWIVHMHSICAMFRGVYLIFHIVVMRCSMVYLKYYLCNVHNIFQLFLHNIHEIFSFVH